MFWLVPVTVLSQSPEGEVYTVQSGDWLSKLAEKYYGDPLTYPTIVNATNTKATEDDSFLIITNPDIIEIGQILWIPSQVLSNNIEICSSTFTTLPIDDSLQPQTLATLLTTNLDLPTETLPPKILKHQVVKEIENGQTISVYEMLDNECTLWLVYYLFDERPESLYLLKYDKNLQTWSYQAINGYLGQFMDIRATKNFYLIRAHINPSAGSTVIVPQDMASYHILTGFIGEVYDDNLIIYHPNQIHFAPTHPNEIGIYNPFTQEIKTILPRKPNPRLWSEYVNKMGEVYEQLIADEWCVRNNHHCKPEWFTRYFGNITVNSTSDSLIFIAHFDSGAPYELLNGQTIQIEDQKVVYIYRGIHSTDQLDYREFELNGLEQIYGEDFEIAELLEQEILDQLFKQE